MAYLSPFAKTSGTISPANQHRNSASNTTPEPALKHLQTRSSLSPTQRTEKWLEGPTPKKDPNTFSIYKVKESKITKSFGTPSHTKIKKSPGAKKSKSFWNVSFLSKLLGQKQNDEWKDDLEGDTYVQDGDEDSFADSGRDNDFTLVVDDYDEESKVEQPERTLKDYSHDRFLDYNDPRIKEWADEEIWLFNKLTNRGDEPLLDSTWTMDFPTFPDPLFTRDPSQVFINNTNGPLYNAARALTNLIAAGSRTRDQLLINLPPEKYLFKELIAYHKWSLMDGRLHHKAHIPVVAIASAKPKETVESVVGRVTDQLHSLGRQYRDKWRHLECEREGEGALRYVHALPTLTGFVVKYSVVAIVTCDSSVPGKPVRTVGTYDFKVLGQDVWNALAVSIAMIRGRNYLMQLDREGELGPEIIDYGSDPDA